MGITADILLAGQVAAAITAIFTLIGLIVKFAIVKPIKAYIDQKTMPIQPTANGGKSLPDAINELHKINKKLGNIEIRIKKLEDKQP